MNSWSQILHNTTCTITNSESPVACFSVSHRPLLNGSKIVWPGVAPLSCKQHPAFPAFLLSNHFSLLPLHSHTQAWLCCSDSPLTTLRSLSSYAPPAPPTNHRCFLFHNHSSDEEKATPRSVAQSRISKLRLLQFSMGAARRRATITRFLWVRPAKRKGEVRGSWRSTIGRKNGTRCT